MRIPLLSFLVACGGGDSTSNLTELVGADVGVALEPGQARAGFAPTDSVFWGGISAEAGVGDVKIYNHLVRFAIKAAGESDFYLPQGGHVVDADLVRVPGQPGRDLIDEWAGMAGLGRLMDGQQVYIVDDGVESGVAVVEATGPASPLHLLEGAIEAHGALIDDLGLTITHRYTLPADSYLMQVDTTVTASDTAAVFRIGDAILGAADAATWWGPERGYQGIDSSDLPWNGYIGDRNESAFGLFTAEDRPFDSTGLEVLSGLVGLAAGFQPDEISLAPGEQTTFTRYYGIAPDFAALTDEWLAARGVPTETVSGQALADGEPVAGARATVLVDGLPYTLALTDEDGRWTASVPQGSNTTWVVDGQGTGLHFDLPEGAPYYSPYAPGPATTEALRAMADGAPPIPQAEGYGTSTVEDPGTLVAPGEVTVLASDDKPFEVRFDLRDAPGHDPLVTQPDERHTAAGWARDGRVVVPMPPGTYDVIVHRGPRYERVVTELEVPSGDAVTLEVDLPRAFEHPGWMFGDPHVHAAPSADGGMPMSHRLVNMAGVGVQLHFGTDHDHIAEYAPLLEPLGLTEHLNSVLATEMSPVLRGHLNLFPLTSRGDLPNGGAFLWYRDPVESTQEQFDILRSRHGGALRESAGFAIQVNHPISVGLADLAGWSPGSISQADFWSDDFDAMEVMNGGSYDEYLPLYFDLVNRGQRVTPTGTSDTHHEFSNDPGLNGTFIWMGTDDPTQYTPDKLRAAFAAQQTIVSRGLFLDMSIPPGTTVTGGTTLTVTALGASWCQADRLHLYRDGDLIETAEGHTATFELAPDVDASFVVIAEGDTSLQPLWGETPWALSAAIKVDLDGDGWTPPLAPLSKD